MRHDKTPGWEELHENAVVADLHAHPSIKAALFHRNLAQGYKAILPSAFNPFTVRTAFPNLQKGGVDVLFSAVLAPEKRLIRDIPLLKILRLVKPRMWREIIKPPYFDVTTYLIDDIEQQADMAFAKAWATAAPEDLVGCRCVVDRYLEHLWRLFPTAPA